VLAQIAATTSFQGVAHCFWTPSSVALLLLTCASCAQEGQAPLEEAAVLAQTSAATLRGMYALDAPTPAQRELEAFLSECVLVESKLSVCCASTRINAHPPPPLPLPARK